MARSKRLREEADEEEEEEEVMDFVEQDSEDEVDDDDDDEEEEYLTPSKKKKTKKKETKKKETLAEEDDDDDDEEEEEEDEEEERLYREQRAERQLGLTEDGESPSDFRAARTESSLAAGKKRETSAGAIEEVYMENFMCHKKLEIKLCKRINFINGANGSGKSAILAALQICLGATARSTHRGNKMGDLVREGHQGQATVRVSLWNDGEDAFRAEDFGRKITIERKFAKAGSGSLKLLAEDGSLVSKDRKLLREILDTLKVAVDNPVCVLDQENSKNFIRGKAKEKYDFFLKATEIATVLEKLQRVTHSADQCIQDAERQRSRLSHFADAHEAAKREYEEVVRLGKFDEEITNLKVALGFVTVAGAEKAKEAAEAGLQKAVEAADRATQLYEEAKADFDSKYAEGGDDDDPDDDDDLLEEEEAGVEPLGEHDANVVENPAARNKKRKKKDQKKDKSRIRGLEEAITRYRNEMSACSASTHETTMKVKAEVKQSNALKRDATEKKRTVAELEKETARVKKDLDKVRAENEKKRAKLQKRDESKGESRDDDEEDKEDEITALAKEVAAAEAQLKEKEDEESAARAKLEELKGRTVEVERRAEELDMEAKRRDDDARDAANTLKFAQAQARSPLAAWGEWQPALRAAVDKNPGRFSEAPIGPLGSYIQGEKGVSRWLGALDVALPYSQLQRWIVASTKDKDELLRMVPDAAARRELSVVVQKTRPRFEPKDLRRSSGGRISTTVASVLEIANDRAFNCLVDLNQIDAACLFESKAAAEESAFLGGNSSSGGGQYEVLPGVGKIYLPSGDEMGARKGSLYYRRNKAPRKALSVALDSASSTNAVPTAQRLMDDASSAARDARDAFDSFVASEKQQLKRDLRSAETSTKKLSKLVDDVDKKVKKLQRDHDKKVAEKAAELADEKADEEAQLEDTSAYDEDLSTLKAQIDEARRDLRDAEAEVEKHVSEVLAPLETTKRQHEERNQRIKDDVADVEKAMGELMELEEEDKKKVAKAARNAEKATAKLQEHRKAVDMEVERVEAVTAKANKFALSLLGDAWTGTPPSSLKTFKSEKAVKAKIDSLTKTKDRQLKNKDVAERDPLVAKEKWERAAAAYREKERGCKQVDLEGRQLREDAQRRWDRLKDIRKHICRQSNRAFDDILQKKGASGSLHYNHKENTLGLTFQKDNADKSTQLHNVVSLSGGERSFTTLAMLLAVGESIECPFRVMDEFDVFMDQVARKVAMKELVEMAKQREDKQFIFITPQDLSSLPQSNILKVFKLHAPIRGQQTLNFTQQQSQQPTQQSQAF